MEAILWHGGEAEAARNAVLAMDSGEREALIEYVKFPFVDPAEVVDAPACPPDLNGDGLLNFFDVSAFLSAYSAMDAAADFNGDGQFNFFDVSIFLSQFNAGCP